MMGQITTAQAEGLAQPQRAPRPAFTAWRRGTNIIAAVFCGFMFATAGTALVPRSALWAGRFICSSGYGLTDSSYTTNQYGPGRTDTIINFSCVKPGGPSKSVGVVEVGFVQFLLGTVVAYLLIAGFGALWWLRPNRPLVWAVGGLLLVGVVYLAVSSPAPKAIQSAADIQAAQSSASSAATTAAADKQAAAATKHATQEEVAAVKLAACITAAGANSAAISACEARYMPGATGTP